MDKKPPALSGWATGMGFVQVGFEMVAPIGLGVWLDGVYATTPWLTLGGIALGFRDLVTPRPVALVASAEPLDVACAAPLPLILAVPLVVEMGKGANWMAAK